MKFGPIVVVPRVDHDGDDYLRSYIVFEGDQKKLDPRVDAKVVQTPMVAG